MRIRITRTCRVKAHRWCSETEMAHERRITIKAGKKYLVKVHAVDADTTVLEFAGDWFAQLPKKLVRRCRRRWKMKPWEYSTN
jgi:hypothetical protein